MTGKNTKKCTHEKYTDAEIADKTWLYSSTEICDFFSISAETLSTWRKRGCPQEAYGKYDLQKVVFWKFGSGNEASPESRKIKADVARAELRAKKEQLQFEVMAGQFIPKDDAEQEWASRVVEVKAGLMCLPRELAGEFTDTIVQRTVEAKAREKIFSLLESYSRDGTYTPRQKKKG